MYTSMPKLQMRYTGADDVKGLWKKYVRFKKKVEFLHCTLCQNEIDECSNNNSRWHSGRSRGIYRIQDGKKESS